MIIDLGNHSLFSEKGRQTQIALSVILSQGFANIVTED
tara:strand:- start:16 stop:129 length:114 start_codon:yes stop_codon:yes gene_type:complete